MQLIPLLINLFSGYIQNLEPGSFPNSGPRERFRDFYGELQNYGEINDINEGLKEAFLKTLDPELYDVLLSENAISMYEHYFFFTDEVDFLKRLDFSIFNIRMHYVICFTKCLERRNIPKVAFAILDDLWSVMATNAVLIVCDLFKNIEIYSYMPFTPARCNNTQVYQVTDWSEKSLFRKKFQNLYNCPLKVCCQTTPEFFSKKMENGVVRWTGFIADIFYMASRALNFSTEIVVESNETAPESTRVEEHKRMLKNREVHVMPQAIFISDSKITEDTFIFFSENYNFIMKRPGLVAVWKNALVPFSGAVWRLVTMTLVVILCTVAAMEDDQLTPLLAWSTFFGVSGRLPRTRALRVLMSLWVVYSMVITNAYQGILVGCLTVPRVERPIKGLRELLNSSTPFGGKLFARDYFLLDDSSLGRDILGRFHVIDVKDVPRKLTSILDGEDFALAKSRGPTVSLNLKNSETRQFYIIPEPIIYFYYKFTVPRRVPWVTNLSWVLEAILEAGLSEKIYIEHFGKYREKVLPKPPNVLRIGHLYVAFVVLFIGIFIATFTFIAEVALYR